MSDVKKGDKVEWKWGKGTADGKVDKVAKEKTEIKTKGKTVTRKGTADNPAVVIKQDSGTKVIKSEKELK